MEYEIDEDEVILYKGFAVYVVNSKKTNTNFTLTSKKMIFEQEKGVFKKTIELIDIVELSDLKIYNGEVQCKQKMTELQIQTKKKNFLIYLTGIFEAKKVNTLIINTITGTTVAKRGSNKVKDGLDLVDETLDMDTRGVVRGLLENGIKGSIINGIKGKKNNK